MPSKATLLTIDENNTKRIETIGRQKGLPFATICRSLIIERINEMFPEKEPSKATNPGIADTPAKGASTNV